MDDVRKDNNASVPSKSTLVDLVTLKRSNQRSFQRSHVKHVIRDPGVYGSFQTTNNTTQDNTRQVSAQCSAENSVSEFRTVTRLSGLDSF